MVSSLVDETSSTTDAILDEEINEIVRRVVEAQDTRRMDVPENTPLANQNEAISTLFQEMDVLNKRK
ncbi:hypothetical protein [Enterococcus villorum]|nr:hypothetical protein [Enterococcus villorum]